MDDDNNSNEKVIFIISFLALLFALPNYKDYLEPIRISLFSYSTSLYVLFLTMGFILFLSVYFYAIDNIKYCSFKLVKITIFSHTSLIADLLYTIAIIVFPIVILLLYISSNIVLYIKSTNFDGHTVVISINIIVSLLSALFALISLQNTLKANMERRQDNIEKARDSESISLLKATEVYESGYYDYMLIELNNAIEKSLYAKLAKKDSIENNRYISPSRLVKFAEQEKLISATEKALIEEVRNLRNQVAHGSYNLKLDEDKAKQLLDGVITLTSQLSKI